MKAYPARRRRRLECDPLRGRTTTVIVAASAAVSSVSGGEVQLCIMASESPQPRLRFRLILGRSIAIGSGKADLLAAIASTGSISAAGRSMGMSYKKAWYLIDTMNRCFREPLVMASKGGSARGGAQLTAMGEKVLVGTLGGLIGLGGAEFRLPVLIGPFRFAALEAVILNKAMSLVVVASALPFRAGTVPFGAIAENGIYRLSRHMEHATPATSRARAAAYDAGRNRQASVRVLSAFDLEKQIGANGATWLDRRLVMPDASDLAPAGFGQQVREAMNQRREHHI